MYGGFAASYRTVCPPLASDEAILRALYTDGGAAAAEVEGAVALEAAKTAFGDYMLVAFDGVLAENNTARGAEGSGGFLYVSVRQGFAKTREVLVMVLDSALSRNLAEGVSGGGALSVEGAGTLVVRGSSFAGNAAVAGPGGAVAANGDRSASFSRCGFDSNAAAAGGGAVFAAAGAALEVRDSDFSGNAAHGLAGAAPAAGAALLVLSSPALGAEAALWGWGAAAAAPGGDAAGGASPPAAVSVRLSGCSFSGGQADVGGALAAAGAVSVAASATHFANNSARANGGAAALARGARLTASGLNATGNHAGASGAGASSGGAATSAGLLCDASSPLAASSSRDGGFVWVGPGSSAELTGCNLTASSAAGSGGAAAVGAGATLALSSVSIANASAGGAGGAVAVHGLARSVALSGVSVDGASADTGGFLGFTGSPDAAGTPLALSGLALSAVSARVGSLFAAAASAAPFSEPRCDACSFTAISPASGWGDRVATQLARLSLSGPAGPVRSGRGFSVSARLEDALGQAVRALPGRVLSVECAGAAAPGATHAQPCVVSGQVQELYKCADTRTDRQSDTTISC